LMSHLTTDIIRSRKRALKLAINDWRERKYSETLEGELAGLAARRKIDPSFTIEDAEGTLRHLYIQEGNDQGARGPLQDTVIAATIAAYEQFIDAWRKETL
jgi:hypothetical protein